MVCSLSAEAFLSCDWEYTDGSSGCLPKGGIPQFLLNFFRIYGSMQLQATLLLSVFYKSICQRLNYFNAVQKSEGSPPGIERAGAELIPALKFSRMPCGAVRCLCRWGQGHASNRQFHGMPYPGTTEECHLRLHAVQLCAAISALCIPEGSAIVFLHP